jgi:hypothetical protein
MPGPYTALLFGVNNGTGVGLVEAYDLGASASALKARFIPARSGERLTANR